MEDRNAIISTGSEVANIEIRGTASFRLVKYVHNTIRPIKVNLRSF